MVTIDESESQYYRRRASDERAAAEAAESDHVGSLHRELATLYERRARGGAYDGDRRDAVPVT